MITNNYFKKLILAFIEHLTMSFRCITLYNPHNSLKKVEGVLIIPRMWIGKLRLSEVMPLTPGVSGEAVLESQVYLRPTQALNHLQLPLLPVTQLLPVNHCCQQTNSLAEISFIVALPWNLLSPFFPYAIICLWKIILRLVRGLTFKKNGSCPL